jgi:succinyl-diaminopimelate desuccinylase
MLETIQNERKRLRQTAQAHQREVVEIASRLVATSSEYPPGDTRLIADEIEAIVAGVDGLAVSRHPGADHVINLVLRVQGGGRPGRRLILNGHLDTFPLGDPRTWTAAPSGEERDGKLYGLGVSDMKGGIAAILFALKQAAACRAHWSGELVATLAGDEESMGVLGSKHLLDTVPFAHGDVMLSADAGSPRILRFGEKGMIWLTLRARGRSAHAAHVHRGESAIEKLIAVITALQALREFPVASPQIVLDAIAQASTVSEQLSGQGETEVLRHVTITFGTISGGRLSNLVADEANATADIRLPVGVTVAEIEAEIRRIVDETAGVELDISRRYEPSWTAPDHEIVGLLTKNCAEVLGVVPVVNMRVGASDARHYRGAGVPTIVCGLTPHNMGAADEYVHIDELVGLGELYSVTAYDYLTMDDVG